MVRKSAPSRTCVSRSWDRVCQRTVHDLEEFIGELGVRRVLSGVCSSRSDISAEREVVDEEGLRCRDGEAAAQKRAVAGV